MKVGQILLEEGRAISLKAAARTLDVESRTLSNWKREAREGAPERKLGRPRHASAAHRQAMWRVGRELRSQGYPGWRAIARELHGVVPDRLTQLYVKRFKMRRIDRKSARIALNRISVTVMARDTIWGQDGTHVGRTAERGVEAQVLRDRGSLAFVGLNCGPTANHKDVLDLFEESAKRRGAYPLVYSRDNGSMYAHEAVGQYMEVHQIIVLRNLPRTSQHNGATERAIRELKDATGLGKGELIQCLADTQSALAAAAQDLNENRIRPSKGFKTANELDETLPVGYNCIRDRFYRECRSNMERALQGSKTKRAGRLAEREAVFSTLQKYGLIERSRGGKPYVQKQEIFL